MTDLLFAVRFIHIVAGLTWVGEVVTINFVVLPALERADPALRARMLGPLFPLIFRLATILGGLAVLSGATLYWMMSKGDLGLLTQSRWGVRVLIGGSIGLLIYSFHLFQESRMEGTLARRLVAAADHPEESDALLRHLRVIPRIGLAILLIGVLFMSSASHLP